MAGVSAIFLGKKSPHMYSDNGASNLIIIKFVQLFFSTKSKNNLFSAIQTYFYCISLHGKYTKLIISRMFVNESIFSLGSINSV